MDGHATSPVERHLPGRTTNASKPGAEPAASDMRTSMDRMTSAFLHQAEDAVASQQSLIAAVMRDLAHALRNPGASDHRPETQRVLGTGGNASPILVSALSDALETSAARVEAIDINRITGEISRTLREQPIASAGLAALAGFAVSRFVRTASR